MPAVLFHATYRPYLESIFQWGLGGSPVPVAANWPDSAKGVVYLAETEDIAYSYAECAESVADEWLDEIVVLQVDVRALDIARLEVDPNVLLEPGQPSQTYAYRGVVPVVALKVLNLV